MPEPLTGLVPVAEFGTLFEADAAVALLQSCGMPAVTSADPALRTAASYYASDRTCEVLVRHDDRVRAAELLASSGADLPAAFQVEWAPTTRAARARSRMRSCLITSMVATLALLAVVAVLAALT